MKIDVHWHYLPEQLIDEMRRPDNPWPTAIVRDERGVEWMAGGAFRHPLPPELYRPEAQVAEMDRRGIDLVAVSPAPHAFAYAAPAERIAPFRRMVNDRIAELNRAMEEKGLKGVEIGTNVAGRNLDEPEFRPFFKRAAELGALVFGHPGAVLGANRLSRYYLTNLIGNPTDTAVAIASLIFGGVYDEAPSLTCCFAHGGGSFPALIGRWQHGYAVRPEPQANGARPPRAYLDRIYV